QVDSWGNDGAFNLNLQREYERNSERYSLLKWAQSNFRDTRVFPPDKGICHQVNLEFLSRVVAVDDSSGQLCAFPDTLVGTDSHTTMVNGLGVLGWGVGGIEAEAVMLGEPYPMPIPRVLGVKLTGHLREGVTPTDLVLAVTERLRAKNVVGYFVEYFGEGYRELSVPDRATLGNMSPEYGATVGFSPVDGSTLVYLRGTGRDASLVELVRRYSLEQGFYLSEEEPSYSEVLEIDLSKVEPAIAGPRNPEERRPLFSVPSFARTLLDDYRGGASQKEIEREVRAGSNGFQALAESGSFGGLNDGAVVIAAITSCTNTSNPTVMVGAGLLAKKAVERGLTTKSWVKKSFAPGSSVVTDYLSNSGLLAYLDKLGFNLVGYGCTTCIAEGTHVLLSNGTTKRIEQFGTSGGARVFGPTSGGRLSVALQTQLIDNGEKDCVELVFQDGRTLVCTPDHKILRSDGSWTRADELTLEKDRVTVGLEGVADVPGYDEAGYLLQAGELMLNMKTESERTRTLAFARLLGYILGDGSISTGGQGRISVGQAVDRETVLEDIELLTGLKPAANRYDPRRWSIVLPSALTNAFRALPGVTSGRRIEQPPSIPYFVLEPNCPVAVVREFLGGLFGADGHAPMLSKYGSRAEEYTLSTPVFSFSTIPDFLEKSKQLARELVSLLARCGVQTNGTKFYVYPTRRAVSTYPPPKDQIPRLELRIELPDGLSFVEKVGYRYCVSKSMCASAAAVYWRTISGINAHRLWMADRLTELHAERPSMTFNQARHLLAVSLLGHEGELSLPPVTSPHYALLEGHDRFSRLPSRTGQMFRPLHRESAGFPSPISLLAEIGAREWFPSHREAENPSAKHYCVDKESLTLPTFSLRIIGRRSVGHRRVYDLTVSNLHAFVAGSAAVHNCIGNSGPLAPEVEKDIVNGNLYAVAVLSGNRNFDGRIHPLVRGSFLMSPMLVVAYALAGRIDFDFYNTPLGAAPDGTLVFLKDVWPSLTEIKVIVEGSLKPELFGMRYKEATVGDPRWDSLASYSDDVFHWEEKSSYVRLPPWFGPGQSQTAKSEIHGARALAILGDKVTTDHISPAGSIPVDSPAGRYLLDNGVDMIHFSTYGSRRGNHEVMVRGGFANTKLRNALVPDREGGWTVHQPSGKVTTIYDASVAYAREGVPLIVLAGKQYGAGSSRDWAAKAPKLLGVRAVIAEDFERIHRGNLIAMG
ncbi:MAG TPA: aconitase family protein, partial [Nitrososphaerales archaeon]|nr:aconitase family protein [Nitrososphaerales archaeon]